ncbi:MAG: DUF2399 domain-containing protein [Candidatus Dormibacteraeota bacterium]|nr:DUF2399 domain-containing protein [Candidatus Dormibacteraeota bacterium]
MKTQMGDAPAMVCVGGRPNTAAATLLGYRRGAGVALRYHGDFDYPGLAIANEVVARLGAVPWKFDTASYLRAVERHPGVPARRTLRRGELGSTPRHRSDGTRARDPRRSAHR